MRWNDDLPEEWSDAPDDPPRVDSEAKAVELEHGLSILSDDARAWIYADEEIVESVG